METQPNRCVQVGNKSAISSREKLVGPDGGAKQKLWKNNNQTTDYEWTLGYLVRYDGPKTCRCESELNLEGLWYSLRPPKIFKGIEQNVHICISLHIPSLKVAL